MAIAVATTLHSLGRAVNLDRATVGRFIPFGFEYGA